MTLKYTFPRSRLACQIRWTEMYQSVLSLFLFFVYITGAFYIQGIPWAAIDRSLTSSIFRVCSATWIGVKPNIAMYSCIHAGSHTALSNQRQIHKIRIFVFFLLRWWATCNAQIDFMLARRLFCFLSFDFCKNPKFFSILIAKLSLMLASTIIIASAI